MKQSQKPEIVFKRIHQQTQNSQWQIKITTQAWSSIMQTGWHKTTQMRP